MLALVSFQLSCVYLLSLKIKRKQFKEKEKTFHFQWYLLYKETFLFGGKEEISREGGVGDSKCLKLLLNFNLFFCIFFKPKPLTF